MWAHTINQSQIILQESNYKAWKNNKVKNQSEESPSPHYKTKLWITWSLTLNPTSQLWIAWCLTLLHEERTLSYIHESLEECHNYRSTILSTYSFKSSTHILDKISYQNLHDLLLWICLNGCPKYSSNLQSLKMKFEFEARW